MINLQTNRDNFQWPNITLIRRRFSIREKKRGISRCMFTNLFSSPVMHHYHTSFYRLSQSELHARQMKITRRCIIGESYFSLKIFESNLSACDRNPIFLLRNIRSVIPTILFWASASIHKYKLAHDGRKNDSHWIRKSCLQAGACSNFFRDFWEQDTISD